MATVRFGCHGNVPSRLTLHLLPTFPEIQPLLPIGSQAPREFPPVVPVTYIAHNSNQTICLCAAVKNFCFLSDAPTPSFPPPPSVTQSLLLFPPPPTLFPQSSPHQPLHHITVSLWKGFIVSSLLLTFSLRRGAGDCGSRCSTRTRQLGARSSTGTR